MSFSLHLPPGWGASGFIVSIPARNEEKRLPFALSALSRGAAVDVIVIANGCTDDTARVAQSFDDLPVAVLNTGDLPGGVGAAPERPSPEAWGSEWAKRSGKVTRELLP